LTGTTSIIMESRNRSVSKSSSSIVWQITTPVRKKQNSKKKIGTPKLKRGTGGAERQGVLCRRCGRKVDGLLFFSLFFFLLFFRASLTLFYSDHDAFGDQGTLSVRLNHHTIARFVSF
jgi:hypothetical protein